MLWALLGKYLGYKHEGPGPFPSCVGMDLTTGAAAITYLETVR